MCWLKRQNSNLVTFIDPYYLHNNFYAMYFQILWTECCQRSRRILNEFKNKLEEFSKQKPFFNYFIQFIFSSGGRDSPSGSDGLHSGITASTSPQSSLSAAAAYNPIWSPARWVDKSKCSTESWVLRIMGSKYLDSRIRTTYYRSCMEAPHPTSRKNKCSFQKDKDC